MLGARVETGVATQPHYTPSCYTTVCLCSLGIHWKVLSQLFHPLSPSAHRGSLLHSYTAPHTLLTGGKQGIDWLAMDNMNNNHDHYHDYVMDVRTETSFPATKTVGGRFLVMISRAPK